MDLSEFPARTRVYFALLTFGRGRVNVIALKIVFEKKSEGYAFLSHFELPASKSAKNVTNFPIYVEKSVTEMKKLFSEDWTFLQTVDKSFTFRIERGDKEKNFLRHRSCNGEACKAKRFDGSIALENTFLPLEKKQVFFTAHEKKFQTSKSDLNFEKRCYLLNTQHVQFCPDIDKSGVTRCKGTFSVG